MASLIEELIADGLEHAEAEDVALQVVKVSDEEDVCSALELEAGPLTGILVSQKLTGPPPLVLTPAKCAEQIANDEGRDALVGVLSTALKYFVNNRKSPWSPAFRSFRLSFKVADRISSVLGGLQLLELLGFAVHATVEDFVASIPIYADIDGMHESIEGLLQQYRLNGS